MSAVERRARLASLGLVQPGLWLILICLLIPLVWLAWMSAFDATGALSAENYARLTRRVYKVALSTTLQVSLWVTLVCTLLAYPMAYAIVHAAPLASRWLTMAVTLPFWTSVLVRTYAWMVLLQREGLVNKALMGLGLTDAPLTMVNNRFGVVLGMVHVMLPFMIFPLAATMRSIDPVLMRAASVCGAGRTRSFFEVYLPQTLPGLATGASLVFVLSLGFFITPALLGGGKVIMWSQQIVNNLTLYANYGAASAMGIAMLVVAAAILFAIRWLTRERVKGARR